MQIERQRLNPSGAASLDIRAGFHQGEVLLDISANVTFVRFDGDRELLLPEEFPLRGSGAIGCGASTAGTDAWPIRFQVG